VRTVGVGILLALVLGTAASAATPGIEKDIRAFTRARHGYDTLPKAAKRLIPRTAVSRRVATALDLKRRPYYVYVTKTRDNKVCAVLIQAIGYTTSCTPAPIVFGRGHRTETVFKGLVGGVAANDVTKIVLQGRSRRLTIPLSKDNGFLYGCPAPGTCAKWVKTVLGYNRAGKLVSREIVA
jgi:hypothetical protein